MNKEPDDPDVKDEAARVREENTQARLRRLRVLRESAATWHDPSILRDVVVATLDEIILIVQGR